jgi:hypothetical protein
MIIKLFLGLSLVVNLWFATQIIRLERFHYSTMTGSCSEQVITKEGKLVRVYDESEMYKCLSTKQPRTSDLWNLFYGLKPL